MIIVCLTTAVNTTAIWCHRLLVVRLRPCNVSTLVDCYPYSAVIKDALCRCHVLVIAAYFPVAAWLMWHGGVSWRCRVRRIHFYKPTLCSLLSLYYAQLMSVLLKDVFLDESRLSLSLRRAGATWNILCCFQHYSYFLCVSWSLNAISIITVHIYPCYSPPTLSWNWKVKL